MIVLGVGGISQDFQVDFNGLLLGAGTPYGITKFGGFLDMPAVRNTHDPIPKRDGMYLSPDYAGERIYDIDFDITASSSSSFTAAVNALMANTWPQRTLLPLRFQLPGMGVRVAYVQCQRRAVPVDIAFEYGLSSTAALQFYAPDGRQFGPAQTLAAGIRTGGGGLSFPLSFPLTFGTPASGGRVTFVNTGTMSTEPVITVSGPLTSGFEVTHVETGRRLRYEAPVGTPIVLDCGAGTCLTQGQERSPNLTVREWFSVPALSSATFAWGPLSTADTATSAPTAALSVAIAPAYT